MVKKLLGENRENKWEKEEIRWMQNKQDNGFKHNCTNHFNERKWSKHNLHFLKQISWKQKDWFC